MNIIFWILEEDIPYRLLYEYFINVAFPHLLGMLYNVDFGNIMTRSDRYFGLPMVAFRLPIAWCTYPYTHIFPALFCCTVIIIIM